MHLCVCNNINMLIGKLVADALEAGTAIDTRPLSSFLRMRLE